VKIKQVLNSVNSKHTRRLLRDLYHRKGLRRKPINPIAMLIAQLLKHLLRIPSDRRLALHLKHNRRTAEACGFKKQTPSHGLFTHFRHRLGHNTYNQIFNQLLRGLLEDGARTGEYSLRLANVSDVLLVLLVLLIVLVFPQALADGGVDLLGPLHELGGVYIELEDGG